MNNFTSVADVPKLSALLLQAVELKDNPFKFRDLGKNKTLAAVYMNPSLRSRLSTQKAAVNLGMEVMTLNVMQDGWNLEMNEGAVMSGDKAEHIKEAAGVIGRFCDILGLRTFAGLQDRAADYDEKILSAFMRHAGVPLLSLESAVRHPLQSLADLLTIESRKTKKRPKVVLTWAPHPKALPQAVANSFAEWTLAAGYDLTVHCPSGMELAEAFCRGAKTEYDREKAFEGADFIYAKNWSSYKNYGQRFEDAGEFLIDEKSMQLTDNAYFMHCLPVRRNVVVSDAVLDSSRSLVLDQAENRVYSAQVVLKNMLEKMQ